MRLSEYFLPTLREDPKDADIISHKLMVRAGMIRKLASGIYEFLPLGLRVMHKVERIVREEMDRIGGQELYLPAVLPREIWDESGRWELYGRELMRFTDRNEREFCLGPTHEEVITDIVRKEVSSYRKLPLLLYQFQVKFRDEIRPRFGVMRAREFYMKDAYSFDATEEDAEKTYRKVFDCYGRICERCGLRFRAVEAQTGAIGGSFSHEFMALAETGEEGIVSCACGYAANVEKAESVPTAEKGKSSGMEPLKEARTPGMRTVEEVGRFLAASPEKFIKSLIYMAGDKPVMVLVRGDYELNETKLKNYLGVNEISLASADKVEEITGSPAGFAGPRGLKKEADIIADFSAANVVNGITGANRKDCHFVNMNMKRDFKVKAVLDLRMVRAGDACPACGKELAFSRGIEVGHTFKLGTKYSDAMKAKFLDRQGREKPFIMGCYGIGVSRIVAAAIEQSHDEKGIIWNPSIAPFGVLVLALNYEDAGIRDASEKIYKDLASRGYEVLLDDRPEHPGVKFNDADLIGIPVRITIGRKTLEDGGRVEIKLRKESKHRKINMDEVLKEVKLLSGQKRTAADTT